MLNRSPYPVGHRPSGSVRCFNRVDPDRNYMSSVRGGALGLRRPARGRLDATEWKHLQELQAKLGIEQWDHIAGVVRQRGLVGW